MFLKTNLVFNKRRIASPVLCDIPEYIHICHRNDPKVAECIKDSIEFLRPQLAKGLDEIESPGIDPFVLERVTIFESPGSKGLFAYLQNMEVQGAGNFKITKLKLDVEGMTYRLGIHIPLLYVTGSYNVSLNVVQNSIKEYGDFHANISDIDGQGVLQGALEGNHLIMKSFQFKINVGDFDVDLGNLFESNPVIRQMANDILLNNKAEIMRISLPIIERKISEHVLDISNRITRNLDYNEVFPA
ncbi:hypothetical protein GWI33_002599 [Rhynchophorus ferrugineus]|uniref:Circadian clock-controlled protein n=1 Tax=Rhynchophorus ferrugineus TaxID=354439 RepID=A0A834MJJ8_RHYFE|nr:hypothetical protein GWI33_002599 [Rhynchophorus ferrugineus]